MLGYRKEGFVHITLQWDYTSWQGLWKHALRMELIERYHPIIQKLWYGEQMVREQQLKPTEPVVTPFSMKTKYLTEEVY